MDMEQIDQLIAALRSANYQERDAIKAQLLPLASGPAGAAVRDHLETAKREELLEVQWEIEEILETVNPKKPDVVKPAPPPEPPPDPNRPLTAKDLVMVYDDPRGLVLHKSKVGERWFATQTDPRTRQPQTFEISPQEVAQLQPQLAGSPYWILGAGAAPKPAAPPRSPLKG